MSKKFKTITEKTGKVIKYNSDAFKDSKTKKILNDVLKGPNDKRLKEVIKKILKDIKKEERN